MKQIIAMFLIIVVSTISFGQINSNYDGPKPEVYKGSKSFIFRYTPFQGNFEPTYVSTVSVYDESSMDLYGAGFQYYFTNEIAVGLGLNFGTGTQTQEFDGGKTETSANSFGISVDGNYHFKPLYSVSPYLGVNLNLGTYSSSVETTTGTVTDKEEYSGSGFGAGVNFGFDWYFTEGLSLGGKYVLGFTSLSKPSYKTGNTTIEGASTTSFLIGSASVMLNVHF